MLTFLFIQANNCLSGSLRLKFVFTHSWHQCWLHDLKIGFHFLSLKILFERRSKHWRQGELAFPVGKSRISRNKMKIFLQHMTWELKAKRTVNICNHFQAFLLPCAGCASRRGGNCILNKRMLRSSLSPVQPGLHPKFPAEQGARSNPKFNKIFPEAGCKMQFGHWLC